MYKHILYATDLSPIAEAVGKKAVELAQYSSAKLSLLHVIEPIPAYGYPGITAIESPHIEEAEKALKDLANKLSIEPDLQHVEIGPTKYEILKIADQINADLIVVGSHGHHGLSRLLGSTASAVLNSATCDVLTIYAKD